MRRRTLPAWRDPRETICTPESLVVVVVEYGADGRAIERERLQLPPRAADPRMDARRASLRRSTVPA